MVIKPLILGNVSFPSNLIQAPLAGMSCAPFRELMALFGGYAYACTEMISAKTLLSQPSRRFTYKSPHEGPVCFQLSGNRPDELKQAARIAVDYGADVLDLNCGCPVDKIRKKGCGSKLLAQSQTLYQLVKALKENSTVPVSIKIRVDGESADQFNLDVVKAIEDAGADFIIVHGRHWTEHYEAAVRLDQIAAIVTAANIPVIGNGDVCDYASLQKMFTATGCAGVMIGRAGVGQPWLYQMLVAEDQDENYAKPRPSAIGQLLLQHVIGLIALEGETLAILQARKLSRYYIRAAGLGAETHTSFLKLRRYDEFAAQVQALFGEVSASLKLN